MDDQERGPGESAAADGRPPGTAAAQVAAARSVCRGYGTYQLVSARGGELRYGDTVTGHGMDLDAVEQYLRSRFASAPARRGTEYPPPGSVAGAAGSVLTVAVQHLNGHAEVMLVGDLDFASAPRLRRALDELIIEGHRDLRINLSALAFLDAAGVEVLVGIRARLDEMRGRLRLLHVRGIPRRVLTACGLLASFDPVEVASRAWPGEQTGRLVE